MTSTISVDEACVLVTDGTHFTPPNMGTGIPFLTVKDVSDSGLDFTNCSFISDVDYRAAKAGNSAPQSGDVLFSKDGTVGKVHVVTTDRPFAVLSSLAILRPRPGVVDAAFLGHALRSPAVIEDAERRKTGSAIRRIVLSDLKRVRIPFPPFNEQRRIASMMDLTNDLRLKRRSALRSLSTVVEAMLSDEFGDPIANPKGLPTAPLADLCRRITDGTHQAPTWSPTGVPFLFVSNIVSGEIEFNTRKFISEETHAELTRRCPIETGDVLYSTVGSYGVPAIVRTSRKFAFQRHIAHLKPNPALMDSEFLGAMLGSPPLRRQADRAARGVAQKTVNLAQIRDFIVFAPPLDIQVDFVRRVSLVNRLREKHRSSLSQLDALFAAMLSSRLRGNL